MRHKSETLYSLKRPRLHLRKDEYFSSKANLPSKLERLGALALSFGSDAPWLSLGSAS